ncbi:response regulator [Conexibacter sp. SYSU D00693]|uniref:response regulator n=1 Tax=Conexibacter sp. SYSU D00693 TaxID=2812560 RepID=UPI00196A407A|nr:response regulator [Conexibacter sp. SYSU D00693]
MTGADLDHVDALLLGVLEGAEPGAHERAGAADHARRLCQSLEAAGRAGAAERARSLAVVLEDGLPLGDRLTSLADATTALRQALDEVGDDRVPATPPTAPEDGRPAADRRRPTEAVLVVGGEPGRAAALVEAAAGLGARAEAVDATAATERLAGDRRPDVVLLLGAAATGPGAEALTARALEAGSAVVAAAGPGEQTPVAAAHVPLGLADRELAATALAALDDDPAEGARVTVVGRDPSLAGAVDAALTASGGTAEHRSPDADHAELGLAPPDLLVIDARTGWQTALSWVRGLRLAPQTAALPVVVLAPPEAAVEDALVAGADDVVDQQASAHATLRAVLHNRLARARAVRRQGDRDPLTGLPRQVVGLRRLGRLVERAVVHGDELAVAIVAVDGLGELNAVHGRAAGDAVVAAAARLVAAALRGEDVVARWGGGEFLVAGRHLAPSTAVQRLEQVARDAEGLQPAGAPAGTRLRLSAGVAALPGAGTTAPALVDAANEALREARQAGGGRIVEAAGPPAAPAADVLVVEDSMVAAAIVRQALEGLGLRVEHVADGTEAAERLGDARASLPRVVLLDWELPGTNGLGVLARMREAGTLPRTRVVMLTGRSGEAEVITAMRAGASDHVAKPFSVPVLVERVRRALSA